MTHDDLAPAPARGIRAWVSEQVRLGTIPLSATIRFDGILSLTRRSHRELLAVANPSQDRGWFLADLAHFSRTLVRERQYADALVRVLVEADIALRDDDADEAATWQEAVETLWRMRDAVESALSASRP